MFLAFLGMILLVGALAIKYAPDDSNRKGPSLKQYSTPFLALAIFLIVGGGLWSMVQFVPAGNRGILLRFGAVQPGNLKEGIHFIFPYIYNVEIMSVRTEKESAKATAASKDLQTVTSEVALNYHVDAEKVNILFQNLGKNYIGKVIDPAIQESLKSATAKFTAEELVTKRHEIKEIVENDLRMRLKEYNIIVEHNGLSITDFQFSQAYAHAIEEKQVAQQSAEKAKYELQRVEREREMKIAEAKGQAESQRLQRLTLTPLMVWKEWVVKWDGKLPQVMSGQGSGGMIIDIGKLK